MANSAPATLTITETTGPGITNTGTVFTDVTDFEVDFKANTIKITHGLVITYYDYSALATLTWTITAGSTAIVAST